MEQVTITLCPVRKPGGLTCGLAPRLVALEIDHGQLEPVAEWLFRCERGHLWEIDPAPTMGPPVWQFRLSEEILRELADIEMLKDRHAADPTAGWLPEPEPEPEPPVRGRMLGMRR